MIFSVHWMSYKVKFIEWEETQIINGLLQNIASCIIFSVPKANMFYWVRVRGREDQHLAFGIIIFSFKLECIKTSGNQI